jgi:ABC-type amino acid transport substrate-binding protein
MRFLLLLVTTSIFMALLASSPSYAKALNTDIVYQRILETKTIRCGYSDWAPFIVTDPNTKEISGVMKDIMDEIGKRLGVKVKWTASIGWGEIVEAANSNKIDLFCNTVWTDKVQLQNMSLSRPLYYTPTYLYVRADDHRFDNNYDSVNKSEIVIVGIDGDTSYVTMRDHFPAAQVMALPNTNGISDQLMSLVAKKADIALGEPAAIRDFSNKNPNQVRQVDGPPLFIMNEVLVTRAGEQQLVNVIDTILQSLINEGFVKKVLKKHDVDTSYPPLADFVIPSMKN